MSDIVLTAAVRQNLLSLQGTAELLATTQTRLATGKKVNSALDNPTNFFTAAGLDARASDISNLLDSIGNGVQVLQAADTGITSLQKLIDTAKSIANQALQHPRATARRPASPSSDGHRRRPAGPATTADLTTSKLNGGVFTFTNSAGTAVTITVGTAASAFDPAPRRRRSSRSTSSTRRWRRRASNCRRRSHSTGRADLHVDQRRRSQTITGTAAYSPRRSTRSTSAPTRPVAAPAARSRCGSDAVSQTARATLVTQYNQIIDQITTTAQDASFNGINLLDGNSLKLIFDETGKSTLTIAGVSLTRPVSASLRSPPAPTSSTTC